MSEIRDTGIPSERDLIEPARRIFDLAFSARSGTAALDRVIRLARELLPITTAEEVEAVVKLMAARFNLRQKVSSAKWAKTERARPAGMAFWPHMGVKHGTRSPIA